ncbi:serine protease [Pilimelia columellifera]|uniref:Serine protease n=1 Tax=Pilimelia columellifera subsp. columellifera TaxID=706583 RepID=A0ABN3NL65_9ACTN
MSRRLTAAISAALTAATLMLTPVAAAAAPTATDPGQRIVGGRPAAEGAYPFMTYLSMGCGGSLISPDIVLSAAHCFEQSSSVTMYTGRVNWRSGEMRSSAGIRKGRTATDRDWAVIKLNRPSTIQTFVKLPTSANLDSGPMFRAIGWGATSEGGAGSPTLREVNLPFVSDQQCREVVAAQEICAGDVRNGQIDTCQGDSGGPLLAQHNGAWVVVGLTSWGQGCARPGNPGHYTQVSYFLRDIRNAITQLGGQQPPA